MGEDSVLILDSSHKFNISVQHSLVTLSKFEVVYGEVSLKDIFHVHGRLWRITGTESVKGVHHSHVQVNCFRLEQSTCWFSLRQHLVDDLVSEVKTLHRKLLSIDLLIRICHIEGATEEQMIIG